MLGIVHSARTEWQMGGPVWDALTPDVVKCERVG